jgi:hypothetical protein
LFGRSIYPDYAYGNNSEWWLTNIDFDIIAKIKKRFQEMTFQAGMTRSQRRLLQRNILKGNRFRKDILFGPSILPKEFIDKMKGLPQQYISGEEINRIFRDTLSDIPTLISWITTNNLEAAELLPQIVRTYGVGLLNNARLLREETSSSTKLEYARKNEGEIRRIAVDAASKAGRSRFEDAINSYQGQSKNATYIRSRKQECLTKCNDIPSIRVLEQVGVEYAIYHALKDRSRNLKESDGGDILHALYIPFVDIYRTDSFMADLVAPVGKGFNTTIVRKTSDLIPAIEDQLSKLQS